MNFNKKLIITLLSITLFIHFSSLIADKAKKFIIFQPVSNSAVDHVCPLYGKAKEINKDKIYRVVVIPMVLMNYHPQGGRIIFNEDLSFKGFAYVGAAGGSIGEQFDILIVETDEKGSIVFDNYIKNAAATNKWTGMSSLPRNTIEKARVRVIRK